MWGDIGENQQGDEGNDIFLHESIFAAICVTFLVIAYAFLVVRINRYSVFISGSLKVIQTISFFFFFFPKLVAFQT